MAALEAAERTAEEQSRLDEEVARDGATLVSFVRAGWHVLEPGKPYVHGWHIDAIAEHLRAVTDGQITRLLINVPPGSMKSLLVGCFWPAFEWGPGRRAHYRYLGTSYKAELAVRDNLKTRRLVESEWYRARWPHVDLARDQNAKSKFENTQTGFREAMAFTGLTGSRGDRVIVDDPLSMDDALSEVEREKVNNTFRESVTTRLNDADKSAIVVVMQRLHENDVSGLILEKDFGYVHLMLPMEFEPERACVTSLGFRDPRKTRDELLWPARFAREDVERDKKLLGAYGTAGQYQQRPAPLGGGMFRRGKAEIVPAAPAGLRSVRGWDLAATEKDDAAYTAGVKIGELDDVYYVVDVLRERLSPMGVDIALKTAASQDGRRCIIDLPTDPGQAGKDSSRHRTKLLAGYRVVTSPETGSKTERAYPFASQWEAGNVKIVAGPWNEAYLSELEGFPRGRFSDQVDASSRAFNQLTAAPRPMQISDEALNVLARRPRA